MPSQTCPIDSGTLLKGLLSFAVYLVLAPCLLFTGVAKADLHVLFSEPLIVSTAAALACFALFAVLIRGRDRGATIIGAMASGYTNAQYIGLPTSRLKIAWRSSREATFRSSSSGEMRGWPALITDRA